MGKAIEILDSNFNEVLSKNKVVLVDFWAEWCGPCKMLGPILEEISEDLKDKLQVVKVNLDENQDLAKQRLISMKGSRAVRYFLSC